MLGRIFESLPELLRVHTRMTLFVLLCVGTSFWYSFNSFASKTEVQNVQRQIIDLVVNVDRRHLEQRIHSIESEIFALERIVTEGTARSNDYDRLSKLRSELGSVERELRRIDSLISH